MTAIMVEISHNSRKLYRLHNKDIIAEKAKIYNIANKERIAIKKRKYKDSIASREKEIVYYLVEILLIPLYVSFS
jgi:hypothetical protein